MAPGRVTWAIVDVVAHRVLADEVALGALLVGGHSSKKPCVCQAVGVRVAVHRWHAQHSIHGQCMSEVCKVLLILHAQFCRMYVDLL